MELSDIQKEAVRKWIGEECGLAEIQRRLKSEYNLSMTYMDVRFLIIDLGLEVKEIKAPAPAADKVREPAATDAGPEAGSPGGVSVDIDMVTKPGAIVNGTVNFSDGVSAAWSLDQLGRLAISATTPGYRPSPEDMQAFQEQLRAALETRGF